MKRPATVLFTTLTATTLVLSTFGARPPIRCIWNVSGSVPVGLYWLHPMGKFSLGELVAIEPPEALAAFLADRRYLPRGLPLLKRVVALPEQEVCRDHSAITVDKTFAGEAREQDSLRRPLPIWQGCHVVADGEVFLMNRRSPDSLDGRYFGVLPTSAILGQAEPLWIGEEE